MVVPADRYKTIIPLCFQHLDLLSARGLALSDSHEFVEALYEDSLDKAIKRGMLLTYFCAPLRPTYEKSGKEHILNALHHASQITGAEYNGRKLAIWIPHYHGLTLHNEFTGGTREFAMTFNNYVIRTYIRTLVKVGELISSGMRDEIALADSLGYDVVHFDEFKSRLQNLPSPEEAEEICNWFIKSLPLGLLDQPAFTRRRDLKRERIIA